MGASLSVAPQDVLALIAAELSPKDIIASGCSCRFLAALIARDDFWRRLALERYGEVVFAPKSSEKSSWRAVYVSLRAGHFRLDPDRTQGGQLLRDRTLLYAQNTRFGKSLDTMPHGRPPLMDMDGEPFEPVMEPQMWTPNGWVVARGDRHFHRGRFYFECHLLWANPAYGDIILAVTDPSEGDIELGNRFEYQGPADTCYTVGLYHNCGSESVVLFERHSSWSFGAGGPNGPSVHNGAHYQDSRWALGHDVERGITTVWLDGVELGSRFSAQLKGRPVVPLICTYSASSAGQLVPVEKWRFPEVAKDYLANGAGVEEDDGVGEKSEDGRSIWWRNEN